MTTMSWFLVWVLVYLVVGIVLKNHTRIGTVQFKDFSTRFIIFYIFPLSGVFIYMLGNAIYYLFMIVSEVIFGFQATAPGKFFKEPNWTEYP